MDLFTYGSLEFAEVMRAVTRRSFAHEPARLSNWIRVRFRGQSYPGIRARPGAAILGTLWRGVDPASFERLDRFETSAYERRSLPVRTAAGPAEAQVYVVREKHLSLLSNEPWEKARFARESLRGFVERLNRS